MTIRFLTAASVLALVSACSSQPGPSSISTVDQGYAAYRSGNFSAAEAAYSSALNTNPSSQAAMLGLAEVYEATDRASDAAALYAKVQAARSGSIRVWDDRQDGVTEVASRRLGALGHGVAAPMPVAEFEAPAIVQPTHQSAPTVVAQPAYTQPAYTQPAYTQPTYTQPIYTQPVAQEAWPENPTYALDDDGIVYYADPDATQPITEPVFESHQAASYTTTTEAPATTYHSADPVVTAPAALYQPMPVAPVQYEPAPITYTPAPVSYEPAQTSYEPAPVIFQPEPTTYAPAPIQYQEIQAAPAPIPTTYQAAPTAPAYSPTPSVARQPSAPAQPLTRTQPGYAVVGGDLVYISAEDIANGTVPPAPAGAALNVPSSYGLPGRSDTLNGIEIPNLN